MNTYPIALTFRPKDSQQGWLKAKWHQVAPTLAEARALALIAVTLNGCECGRLDVWIPTRLDVA